MFLFSFFDVFNESYTNGFMDGFTFMILFRLIGGFFAWKARCHRLHRDVLTFYKLFVQGASFSQYLDFDTYIWDCWVLENEMRTKITFMLEPCRDFVQQPFQSKGAAHDAALEKLKTMLLARDFCPFGIFKRHPVRTIAKWLMYSTAVHN